MAFSGFPLTPSSGLETWWQEVKNAQCAQTHAHTHAAVGMKSAFEARRSEEAWYVPRWLLIPRFWFVLADTVKMSLWLNTLTSQPHSLFTFSLVDGESCTAPVAHTLLCHFTPLFLQESFKSVYYLSALHSLVCLALELQSVGGDPLKYRYKPPSGLNFDTSGSVSHFSLLALCFKTETLSLCRTVWKSPAKWCTGKPVETSHRRVLTLKRPFLQWTPGLKVIRQDC